MSEYAQRFADNEIDFPILCDLTNQDLPADAIPVQLIWNAALQAALCIVAILGSVER